MFQARYIFRESLLWPNEHCATAALLTCVRVPSDSYCNYLYITPVIFQRLVISILSEYITYWRKKRESIK
jgi:hypothetical protein